LTSTSIRIIREKFQEKSLTLPELTHHYIQQIKNRNSELNIFTTISDDEALANAERIQKKIEDGTAGSLAGAVIGIKEAIVEQGKIATAGSGMLKNFESVYNATVIDRLLEADAILIGRTNMDEFAMGSSNETSIHGPVRNPHQPEMVPGGSSGGSAAAIAANMCNATLGSDTGGSIRQPAALCGVTGVKPTYGRVSRHGLIAYASSFDCIGLFTQHVEDSARILQVIAGFDAKDATSSDKPVDDYLNACTKSVSGLKIGVPAQYFEEGLDPEIKQNIEGVLDALKNQGASLVPVTMPNTPYAIATYYILATAEASSNLARYDGIRYGHRADQKAIREQLGLEKKELEKAGKDLASLDSMLTRLYKQSRTESFGTEVKRRIMLGTYVLSAGYYDAYYAKAQKIRRLIQQDFLRAFENVDVIASPTAPGTAFPLGAKMDDPLQMYLSDIYTISANLAGVPGISVPSRSHSNGLPVGIQFLAPHFMETELFRVGNAVEAIVSNQ